MKVDPNEPVYPSDMRDSFEKKHRGIPIRLAIAAQIMAAANGRSDDNLSTSEEADLALKWADALIAAYNKGAE